LHVRFNKIKYEEFAEKINLLVKLSEKSTAGNSRIVNKNYIINDFLILCVYPIEDFYIKQKRIKKLIV